MTYKKQSRERERSKSYQSIERERIKKECS